MKRSRNKRLNKLVFILVHDVEYYLSQEYDRVMSNNGAKSAFTREQRIHEMEAEEVDDDEREAIIVAPDSVDSRQCQIQSFVDQNTAYVVEVSDTNTIISCTCFDFKRRYRPCKHIDFNFYEIQLSKIALVLQYYRFSFVLLSLRIMSDVDSMTLSLSYNN
ncbi:hypothetical protein PHYBLDRAFT_167981 [Phycomyces blakesleeanus NRRL 1555(-)]|uniref:SWIM-type domain-containing protein n=1 Tax=Phycomyces blakesleeanus (strain ATCC 8743b / DSM 1359 / FGSC 10004 / NBRC 33097 / NRRL 1555) TaxID=763407 RepID=A0A162PNT3_PHYB8|nr:hypothetical protein PHYBLDRAFT_167981 [Phycomyces blakesleeanus NRRL 1555(-)]OAD74577.1 hypothetical protein PHYBLDRAFT_167981 [Phycomyces blakesleeanus NRRL 1555(-)]|eukprot:XP_018292617.1 hypothetical protein PHYBLDRAFT_167981 [Phycomyces blakesleeanus NRRL 1555(-)]